jgi:ribose 5-phosphate isomerase B
MQNQYRLIVGSDDAGFDYKNAILADLQQDPRVSSVEDFGVFESDLMEATYPQVALAVGEAIMAGRADRAVLFCGTGMGVALAANKVEGIRAATAHDSFSVERSIMSNNCQVLCMGQRVIGIELARRLASEWLEYEFDPNTASRGKVATIDEYDAAR